MHSSLKQTASFLLLAICGLVWGNPTLKVFKEEPTNILPFPHFETSEVFTCGGVITTTTEQILYKPFREVEANERCVWIVASPGATSYRVRLLHEGSPQEEHLNVMGFSVGTGALSNAESLSSSWTELMFSNALVITFHTSNNVSASTNGFALEYEVAGTGYSVQASNHSTYNVVGAETLFLKTPSEEGGRRIYDNNEIDAFVLHPLNNIYVEGRERQVIYKRVGLEGSCRDRLSVYGFVPEHNSYNFIGNICDHTDTELIRNDDISLLIFRSDSSIEGLGFSLAFANCGSS